MFRSRPVWTHRRRRCVAEVVAHKFDALSLVQLLVKNLKVRITKVDYENVEILLLVMSKHIFEWRQPSSFAYP